MKIGVLSDIHLKKDNGLLQSIIDNELKDVDMFFLCGDLVSMQIYDLFLSKEVVAVSGNMDNREVRAHLPIKRVVELHGHKFGLIHGWGAPTNIEQRIKGEFHGVDCIVYGHSHAPSNNKSGSTMFFNPGSPTDKRSAEHYSVGILTVTDSGITGEIVII